ncbi:MAG: flagellar hook-basal body complex protein [Arcobacteraceae bacterium]|nr:flagellar hook-basal body complex protein [Arcobacteraceae bacterium]
MIGALWTGISGLAGQQTALDNESNNIANVNTIGYKSSRISFADQMYQNKIGKGTTIVDAEKLYKQGNLKVTGVSFDMALSGDGFFAVSNTRGAGMAETYYTRAGNFRMGDNGTLQDSLGNSVMGWAMTSLSDTDIVSTDQNISKFTTDFVKMGASQIVNKTNTVESITAKMTDYTASATADSIDIFSGAGYKTKSAKVSDVEGLISSYTSALINYKNSPDGTSVTPSIYRNTLNFNDAISAGALDSDGDTISVYIDGNKYTQVWDTDLTTTLKAFADQLSSKIKGVNAWITDTTTSTTRDPSDTDGYFRIESLIPGKNLTVSQLSVTSSAGVTTPGVLEDLSVAVETGSGYAAVTAARDALKEAVTGKQQDVYTTTDLALDGINDFTYQLTIFDSQSNTNISVPTAPLTITNPADIDAVVTAINAGSSPTVAGELPYYIKAYNINGNLVIETLDKNYELEISGDMKETTATAEEQTLVITSPAAGSSAITFLGTVLTVVDSDNTATEIGAQIAADTDGIIATWNAANPTLEIASIANAAGTLTITYVDTEGDVAVLSAASSGGVDFAASVETVAGSGMVGDIPRNATYSGRQGANAEFLEITSIIEQTGSRGELQLKLDSLGISNSPFGDFSVDSTGLITMSQDGATFAVGQVSIALFNNNRGLLPIGDNLLQANEVSGTPIYNLNNNKTASVKANTLELSTADLSESLVNLMVFQRAFEANAKSITTADAVLNTLINLKR